MGPREEPLDSLPRLVLKGGAPVRTEPFAPRRNIFTALAKVMRAATT